MSYCFKRLTHRPLVGLCLVAALGTFHACSDDYDLDEEGNNPSWLGQSIYSELQNPSGSRLTGTFTNYLRLVDDLGYAETLSKTGSKTVFVANDEAFARFFANNTWGVSKYEDLTNAQKKQLLYASMLDNALLVEMLSNVSNGDNGVAHGMALKHQTSANVTDTITHLYGASQMPVNNSYWQSHYTNGLDVVMDGTRPMMIHFTNEQMLNNSITTSGENSDFKIITGKDYKDGTAFVFKTGIVDNGADIVCSNGYVNQMEEVIVPPGNLAQLLRNSSDTKLFSRMIDRFSAPFYDATTTSSYNDLAKLNGWAMKDSIFEWRYFSVRSQGGDSLSRDPNMNYVNSDELLTFDPGWNQYYSTYGTSLSDIGAAFIPNDEAVIKYFTESLDGRTIINLYKNPALENNAANIEENIDSIPRNVVAKFVNNMLKTSFVQTVPSKFGTIMDEAADPMDISVSKIHRNSDGTYDVRIANNAVAYILDEAIPPVSYGVVSGKALLDPAYSFINWAIQDKSTLGQNFYSYLLASTANYALFLPTNNAFDYYYIDPASLTKTTNGKWPSTSRVLHFYMTTGRNGNRVANCSAFRYNMETGEVASDSSSVLLTNVKEQLIDILNYHTVVLGSRPTLGTNHYYKTKHGGEVYVSSGDLGGQVMSGIQIDGGITPATITEQPIAASNGTPYTIDRVIQAPTNSVYATLKNTEDGRFSKFLDLCNSEATTARATIERWVAGSTTKADTLYTIFKTDGIDKIVSFMNTYNYTVYAPNNEAMDSAYAKGLPTWDEITTAYNRGGGDKVKVKAMLDEITRFIRYHVQDVSVYADNILDIDGSSAQYATSCTYGSGGSYLKLTVSGGNNVINVTDQSGQTLTVNANNTDKLANKMARDYQWSKSGSNTTIGTSSFAVVHEINRPLNYRTKDQSAEGRYDVDFANL